MKRILVFSDSHGDINMCIKIIDRLPADMIFHAGDIARDVVDLRSIYPDKDIRAVCGNNDFVCSDPLSDVIEVEGIKIFLTHGHNYRVKFDKQYKTLAEYAARNGCQLAVFGHTHQAYEGETNGVRLLNPGSIRFDRSYAIIEIENGKIGTCIIEEPY